MEVSDAYVAENILNGMGFYAVEPEVHKVREHYYLDDVTACVDEVKGLGSFLEIEIMADETGLDGYQVALEKIKVELKKFGFTIENTTQTSYLSQLQQLKR